MRLTEQQAKNLGIVITGGRGRIDPNIRDISAQMEAAFKQARQAKAEDKRKKSCRLSSQYQAEYGPQKDIFMSLCVQLGQEHVEWEKEGLISNRRYKADIYLPDSRIIVEMDGFQYHRSKDAFQKDRIRQNLLVEHGYAVLRYFTAQVKNDLESVINQIVAVHQQRMNSADR